MLINTKQGDSKLSVIIFIFRFAYFSVREWLSQAPKTVVFLYVIKCEFKNELISAAVKSTLCQFY